MKPYTKIKQVGPFGKKMSSATIRSASGNILLRIPAICPLWRADLALDEETFNIHVNINKKGVLKCFKPSGFLSRGKHPIFHSKFISLGGFLKDNRLEYEEMKGVYLVEWVEKPTKFIVLKMTRRSEFIVSKDDKRKITITLTAKEKESWDNVRKSVPMSAFVRSAVNRYLEDEYLI
jgi:hypothetical protein|tara:strand:+ start:9533 stop:10063 length:531 start_codon:yes stop_codon:yes gene_type:complete